MKNYFYVLFLSLFLLSCGEEKKDPVYNIPIGFELEDIYTPSQSSHGSWVSLTEGPDNRFYACDQYGDIYYFNMPDVGETLDSNDVDSVNLDIGYAQGLLWAFNSLYVSVVKKFDEESPDGPTSGVYRLQDLDGDGMLDHMDKIFENEVTGEHALHTMRVSPDGNSLFLIAGNYNPVPDDFDSRLPKNWGEDNVYPKYLDARGHANDLKAPGGWLAKTDPEGKHWELIGAGMRNPFSFGINQDDEMFVYDADMEWDFGMPWYRPTRILHMVSGAEFGWRTGSGKWPVYYPDNLPAVTNMSQGSPTAVIMGKDLAFPSKYKNGLFACDWSFGTMYYVDLQEKGSSYTGNREEFLSGVPLPISNAIAGSDGHLYFTTGGRRLESHLYRLRYTGDLSNDIYVHESSNTAKEARALRQSLEAYHDTQNNEAIRKAWPQLDNEDRFIQYAARIAIEHQPMSSWVSRLWNETDVEKILYAALAYARSGGALNDRIISKLSEIDYLALSKENKITLLRDYALLMIRQGDPEEPLSQKITDQLAEHFPSDDAQLNRELSQILLRINSPGTVDKCLEILENENAKATDSHPEILTQELLDRSERYGPRIAEVVENKPPTEAIHYVTMLSHVKEGWTRQGRKRYFEWFFNAFSKQGGMSYKAFLDNIRVKALSNVPEEDYAHFEKVAGFYSPLQEMAALPQPIGPGRHYRANHIGGIIDWKDDYAQEYTGTIADGERAYQAAMCQTCHRMKGEGGISGPDLTNIHTRFERGDLVNAILIPSEEISDQHAFSLFTLKNGENLTGSIVEENEETIKIYQSPYDMTQTIEIKKSDIESREISPISPMPSRLLDRMNEDEVRDLFVYLLSGADPDHASYTQNPG